MNYNNLEAQLLDIIKDLCKKYGKTINYDEIVNNKKQRLDTYGDSLIKKIKKQNIDVKELDLKLEKVYMDKLDNIISVDIYTKMRDKLESKKRDILNEIKEMQKNYDGYIKNHSIDKLLDPSKVVHEYLKVRNKEKRDLLVKIIDKIEIHKDKTVDVHFKLKTLDIAI